MATKFGDRPIEESDRKFNGRKTIERSSSGSTSFDGCKSHSYCSYVNPSSFSDDDDVILNLLKYLVRETGEKETVINPIERRQKKEIK